MRNRTGSRAIDRTRLASHFLFRFAGTVALAGSLAAASVAQAGEQDMLYDIMPFRVTDVSGDLSIRYDLDEWSYENPQSDTFTSTPMWEEELTLRATGYVYHPALLDWTVGGGPLLVQYAYDSDGGRSSGSESLFNFDAQLDFLQRRAAPFTLHYRRDHPEITTGLSGRFLATTDEYGISGRLNSATLPLALSWEAAHFESQGSGFGTTVDEDADRASLRTTLPYFEGDSLRARLNWNERNSRSGAPGLPIQASRITTSSAELEAENGLGAAGEGMLNQGLRWTTQDTEIGSTMSQETIDYTGDLRWKYSDATRSALRMRWQDTERTGSWSRGGGLNASASHEINAALGTSGQAGYQRDQAPGYSQDVARAGLQASYRRDLPFGTLGATVNLGLDRTDRVSDTDRITVFDETVVLAGTTPVPLSRDFVVPETVVVTNTAQTQTFTESVDYRLVTVGSTTSIERLITGSIGDGQAVLVTYDVLTGGTVKYDTSNLGISLTLGFAQHGSVFLQFADTSHDVRSGVATTPFNDVTHLEAGGRFGLPFGRRWLVGAEYRYRDHQEDISPYISHRLDTYAQARLPRGGSLRLGVVFDRVDIENSVEDINAIRYTLGVNGRLRGGIMIEYTVDYLEDDGGTLDREEFRHSVRLQWGYRLVRFTLTASQGDIRQGESVRDSGRVIAELTRVFN